LAQFIAKLIGHCPAHHFAANRSSTPARYSLPSAEALACTAKGHSNPEIAAALAVSENTVRFHLKNIYEKLLVANRTEAAAWYFRKGGDRTSA
jgi:LuxR family maltose regulon positive regulatory protein